MGRAIIIGRIPTISGNKIIPLNVRRAKYAVKPAPKVDKRFNTDVDRWADEGTWVRVKSSWVVAIRFDKVLKRLFVQYKKDKAGVPGPVCRYDNVATRKAKDMFQAASMGKFVHRHLYHLPYSIVN